MSGENMSDSDETVCNGSGDENENAENSPSILSNWHQNSSVFPTTKNGNSSKSNLPVAYHEKNSDNGNGDEIVQQSESSPEFPLLTRGVKRKESYDETDDTSVDIKEIQSETNSTQNPDQNETKSSSQSENILNINVPYSETTNEDEKLENLLKTVDELVKDMERTCEREGEIANLDVLQDAKCQLSDIQKLLVECNRKNQVKRKMVTADAEDSQQLDDSKKLMIVNLAKKQRHLLEAFKKYKSFVQRLKAIKERHKTTQRSGKLSDIPSAQEPSKSPQKTSTSTLNSSVSAPSSREPLVSSIASGMRVTQSFMNQSNPKSSMLETPNSSSVATSKSLTPSLTSSTSQAKIQSQTIRDLVTCSNQSMTNQTFQLSSKENPLIPCSTMRETRSSSTNQTSSLREQSQNISGSTVSISRSGMIQNSTGSSIATNICPSTLRQTAPHITQTNRLSTNEATSITTQCQNMFGSTLSNNCSGINQNPFPLFTKTTSSSVPPCQDLLPPRHRQMSTALTRAFNYKSSQSDTRPQEQAATVKQISGLPLSLDTLVKKGVLAPGKDVLTATSEGKLYSASLSDKGTIISAGGEGFTSPRSWVKAILGSKRKVKNELAWKMVSYKNKPLLDHAALIIPKPSKTVEKSINRTLEVVNKNQDGTQTRIAQNNTRRELINSSEALKALLSNCRVIGISEEEVLKSEELERGFWDNGDAEWIKDDVLKALDF